MRAGSCAKTTRHRRDRRYADLMSGSRTTPIDFDADLLTELRAEDAGKGPRTARRPGDPPTRYRNRSTAPAPASTSPSKRRNSP